MKDLKYLESILKDKKQELIDNTHKLEYLGEELEKTRLVVDNLKKAIPDLEHTISTYKTNSEKE